jgi:hypothetical protein
VRTHTDDRLDEIATAIVRQLHGQPAVGVVVSPNGDVPAAVLVSGTAAARGAVVAAAVDDDTGQGPVIRYAAAQARRLGVPLRVVHVWTERAATRHGVRMTRHERMSDADLLLSEVLHQYLTAEEAEASEREVLHDLDVVDALLALSAEVALMVVAARSTATTIGEPLGSIVRGLVGRTACPLAVLAPGEPGSVTRGTR